MHTENMANELPLTAEVTLLIIETTKDVKEHHRVGVKVCKRSTFEHKKRVLSKAW